MTTQAIETVLTNEDAGYRFAQFVEPLDADYTMGELYRASAREYGRCTSKVYADTQDGARAIGWFFVKRAKYEDTNETYLQGAWISVGEYVPAVPEHLSFA